MLLHESRIALVCGWLKQRRQGGYRYDVRCVERAAEEHANAVLQGYDDG